MFDFDKELAQRYGGFASYPFSVSPALDLYARYHTTPKGICVLCQRKIFVPRKTAVSYYPIDTISAPSASQYNKRICD